MCFSVNDSELMSRSQWVSPLKRVPWPPQTGRPPPGGAPTPSAPRLARCGSPRRCGSLHHSQTRCALPWVDCPRCASPVSGASWSFTLQVPLWRTQSILDIHTSVSITSQRDIPCVWKPTCQITHRKRERERERERKADSLPDPTVTLCTGI